MKQVIEVTLFDNELLQAQEIAAYYSELEPDHPWSVADVVDVAAKEQIDFMHFKVLHRKNELRESSARTA